MAGTPTRRRHQRSRRLALRVPGHERIHRLRQRVEVAAKPASALRVAGIGSAPDVEAGEVRPARVLVAGALHDRQTAGVEDALEPGQARVEAQLRTPSIPPDLQHRSSGYRNGRATRVIVLIAVRDDGTERVVPAAQVDDDKVPRRHALGKRDVAQHLRRREPERECGDTAPDERAVVRVS